MSQKHRFRNYSFLTGQCAKEKKIETIDLCKLSVLDENILCYNRAQN